MAANAYFEIINKDGKMWLQVHPPEGEGDMVQLDEIICYLDLIAFPEYDTVAIGNYLKKENFQEPHLLSHSEIIPERERCVVNILESGERALARFYPPTTGGALLTESDIVSDLRMAGIKHGIRKKAIQHFLTNHLYCRDYIIAEATPPVQGHDASIRYFFDLNTTAKPKLNEDGSVDFHQLGNIKSIQAGDKLATLTMADKGRPGISVTGTRLMPKKVKNKHLRYGRNITLSEDKCTIYSETAGHVTLVDDMVMVSDVYRVPANVDPSTGDIDYNGTVEVTGNVNTGFKIKAEGDIVVNGVVEGATLISGGNIVLKRGIQGMERGELQAEGSVTAKFIENSKVKCKGEVKADAILHSTVECREDVDVLGKKGLINGGSVHTYGNIHATTLGSTMGAVTDIEIISDIDLMKRANQLKEDIEEKEELLAKIDRVADTVKRQVAGHQEVMPEQMAYIKNAVKNKPIYIKELKEMKRERESLLTRIEKNKNACVKVEDTAHYGVRISIKDATRNVHDNISHSKFVKDGADVKYVGLY